MFNIKKLKVKILIKNILEIINSKLLSWLSIVLFIIAIFYFKTPIIYLPILVLSSVILGLRLAFFIERFIGKIVNTSDKLFIRHKHKKMKELRYTILHTGGGKSEYFFMRLNTMLNNNENDVLDHIQLDLIKENDGFNIRNLKLKTSIENIDGTMNMNALFERDKMYLDLVMNIPLVELKSWKLFFENHESKHSVKNFLTGIMYSTAIVSIIHFLWKRIIEFFKNSLSVKIYFLYFVVVFAILIVLFFVIRAREEQMTIYNKLIIEEAIERKKKIQ